MKQVLATPICLFLAATAVAASSDDAWDEFRADVSKKCIAAASGQVEEATAWIDPFGTESFGVAIVSGKSRASGSRVSLVCVYDKKSKAVELSGEIGANALK